MSPALRRFSTRAACQIIWLGVFTAGTMVAPRASETFEIVASPLSGRDGSAISVKVQSLVGEGASIVVSGLDGPAKADKGDVSMESSFSVYTRNPLETDLPFIMGDYRGESENLRFTPRFPLQAGLDYFVLLSPPLSSHRSVYTFSLPQIERHPEAVVTGVYPTSNALPENLLKFYIHFSRPMSQGNVYQHIRLLDGGGDPVDLPFLELGEELWDPEGRRLTLLFDPGRIKTGLRPNREVGSPLQAGKDYTLQIMNTWLDDRGQPLLREYRKTFRAIAHDAVSPDPNRWNLITPEANGRDPLVVLSEEGLDEALMQRVIQIFDDANSRVEGTIEIDEGETRWRFAPIKNWKSGTYRLRVGTILEDFAGNSVGRPFEIELGQNDRTVRPPPFVFIEFSISD